MADIYLKTSPRYPNGARFLRDHFGKFRDAWTAAEQIAELRDRLKSFLTVPIPKGDALAAFRKLRDEAYEGVTLPSVSECIFRVMTRSPNGPDVFRAFDRDLYRFIFGLIDDATIDAAADRLVEPDRVMTLAEQGKEKGEISKKIKELKKLITDKIPADVLGPLGVEEFFRSDVWEAYQDWKSLQVRCDRPVDCYGQLCTSENPFFFAWDYLGLKVIENEQGHRFTPASFDPQSFRVD